MIRVERVAALKRFGYSDPEASFLCLAALHGGYFLRRQFAQFIGRRDGALVTQLGHRVLTLGHARTSTWRKNTLLYHLGARPFYEAIGEPDNRNRRRRELMQIKNRIMGLDFVLEHPNERYLETEREKVEHFTGSLEIEPTRLPAKHYRSATGPQFTVRYFVDKYPIFVSGSSSDRRRSGVDLCFVDEGLVGLTRFESHLALYRPLFEALRDFRLIFVADTDIHFAAARAMFARFVSGCVGAETSGLGDGRAEDLLTYFGLRQLYEKRQFDAFDRSQLIRLRDARRAFSTPGIDALYLAWQAGGDAVVHARFEEQRHALAPMRGSFSTELLKHDYALFGDRWAR